MHDEEKTAKRKRAIQKLLTAAQIASARVRRERNPKKKQKLQTNEYRLRMSAAKLIERVS